MPIAALAVLTACGGRGGSSGGSVVPQVATPETFSSSVYATATPTPLPKMQTVGSGAIFGVDNAFAPYDGDTSSGGQGQTVDGIPCLTSMPGKYHIHWFLGILINGRHLALPDGIGMKGPGADGTYAGFPNWTEYASCYYYLHTHDASGVVHSESPSTAAYTTSIFTLGNFFDVWGRTLSSSNIGTYSASVRAYVAQVPLKTTPVYNTKLILYSGNLRSIPIHSHTVIWLEAGPTFVAPSQLSSINFYEEY